MAARLAELEQGPSGSDADLELASDDEPGPQTEGS
jgi:hypothetical protein